MALLDEIDRAYAEDRKLHARLSELVGDREFCLIARYGKQYVAKLVPIEEWKRENRYSAEREQAYLADSRVVMTVGNVSMNEADAKRLRDWLCRVFGIPEVLNYREPTPTDEGPRR